MRKTILIVLFAAILVSSQATDPSPPVWSPSFYIAYDETFEIDGHDYTFNGQFFYDAINKRQRADKQASRYDPTCNSILPKVNTRCQHLVADEKRYIVFP